MVVPMRKQPAADRVERVGKLLLTLFNVQLPPSFYSLGIFVITPLLAIFWVEVVTGVMSILRVEFCIILGDHFF